MLGIFKKKKKQQLPALVDIDNNPIREGDSVESLRYELGKCKLILVENTFYYESLDKNEKVSWLKMIDATTDRQKVRKINH